MSGTVAVKESSRRCLRTFKDSGYANQRIYAKGHVFHAKGEKQIAKPS